MASRQVPGEGATTVVSVYYFEAAVQRQIERDSLDELIVAAEAEHGPIAVEEIEVKRQRLRAGGRPCSPPNPTTSGCCAVTS